MKIACERCGKALGLADLAFICSYECTFCEACGHILEGTCPNCRGELVRRPRRAVTHAAEPQGFA
ncbi:MAG TPA: DUF1272 domain-containing protein [Candidatus Dormibacteraeota bacterium]|nr:DUF1272 domain-containing protein [Candidatus Dormibacteraeota bacterium]